LARDGYLKSRGRRLVLDAKPTGIKDQTPVTGVTLCFFDSNGPGLTNLNATFTSQTLLCIDRLGFFVLEFENLHRTDLGTFATAGALILIHSRCEHQATPPFSFYFNTFYIQTDI
jgi:hypothetical protein